MDPHPASASAFIFVVKLRGPDAADPRRLRGRVEHVLSGRRHDFDSSAALLECLQHELGAIGRDDAAAAAPRRAR